MSNLRVLMVGDVVGPTGCAMLQKHLARIKNEYRIDMVIVNGENSASKGHGVSTRGMRFFKHLGVDIVTSGNHIWDVPDIYPYLTTNTDLLRPLNFPPGVPGQGMMTVSIKEVTVAVINVQGQVFMRQQVDCPFRAMDTALAYLKHKTPIIFVDMHAEATSEKVCLGYYVDGRVSGVVGTHTHIPTSDQRILPGGTAYVTDLGMVGALNGSLGMKKEAIIKRFLDQMPGKLSVETAPPAWLCAVVIEVDTKTGKALAIERVQIIDPELYVEPTHDQ